ncbi:MAG: hypothetical protein IPG47_13565, partial [Thermoflexaceae bacterium]|nr:hypothetical protein [Thermoflexaceae bacterium]
MALLAALGALILRLRDDEAGVLVEPASYTEGIAGTWQRVNPLFASANDVDQDLSALVFAGLVRAGADGSIEPDLAGALPEISQDGRVYTFRLRKDLKWHDGAPVTSRDVSFTISRMADPAFKGDPVLAESWAGVEVDTPDSATIVFRLRQASAPFLARNATLGVLPEHLLSGLNAQQLYEAPFNAKPVGSGPYRLDALDAGGAELSAYDGYHLGKPELPRLRIRFYPDSPAAIRAVSAGEIDGFLLRESPSEAQLTELTRAKGMRVEQLQRPAELVLYLNNDQAAYFADPRVRRALNLAIDREALVSRVFYGAATPSSSAIAPGTWAHSDDFDLREPRIEEAKRLLDEAGWKQSATTGILTREGNEFRFTIRTDNDPTRVAAAVDVANQLQPLGIRVNVQSTTFSVLRKDFLQERKYDAAVAGWDQGLDPDPYFGWHSSQLGSAGLNLANFGDVVMDELIAKARTTSDIEVRREQYRQIQEKWEDLAPSVVLA